MQEKKLTKAEIDELYEKNKAEFGIMNMAAGNMVKGLLYELQRKDRNTYIRLYKAAKALKFKTYTDNFLEVNS